MKIRSITCFIDPGWPLQDDLLRQAGDFIAAAKPALEGAGYEVQTTRLATPPFPNLIRRWDPAQVIALARGLQEAVSPLGFEYVSLGPALPDHVESYAIIPEILAATENVFLGGMMAAPETGVSFPAVRACARVIRQNSGLQPTGFGNLYFAALANVPPGSPFFPAAYHAGGPPAFTLATESASLAVEALESAGSLAEGRGNLTGLVEKHAGLLAGVGSELAKQFGLSFGGIDFSLAPFPEAARSLGYAMERLGAPAVGLPGSLAAAAILAEALDRAQFPRAGFCGLFLPLMEDATLAERAAEGMLSVSDLLLFSAVCGTGLDTIPLPGDTTEGELVPVLLDLAALAQRLGKPLTARLMPIPGKEAGELTGFDFPYFANTRVLSLGARPVHSLLAGDEVLELHPRNWGN